MKLQVSTVWQLRCGPTTWAEADVAQDNASVAAITTSGERKACMAAPRWLILGHTPPVPGPAQRSVEGVVKITAGGVPRRQRSRSSRVGGRGGDGIIVKHRRQPALGFRGGPALAAGVILDLIALDLADAEVVAFGV